MPWTLAASRGWAPITQQGSESENPERTIGVLSQILRALRGQAVADLSLGPKLNAERLRCSERWLKLTESWPY